MPRREPAAARVLADEPAPGGEALVPAPELRDLPLELGVAEDRDRHADKRRSVPSVLTAMLTPSAVCAYSMRGCMRAASHTTGCPDPAATPLERRERLPAVGHARRKSAMPRADVSGRISGATIGPLAVLMGIALAFRLIGMTATARDGAIRFDDPDTLRRLVRLQPLADSATPYPYRDPADGWSADPARRGTVIHWTLPMDSVILALDRIFAPLYPRARRFEAGAAWAGPVLGTLAVGAFLLLARRW